MVPIRLGFLLVGFGLVGGCATALANDIYIAQNASGLANGQNCANAYPVTFFNSGTNWGSGGSQIGPGSTVHLCGTFTGSAGGTMLVIRGSGSAGASISIRFEPGAKLTAPYWNGTNGAISTNGNRFLTIDGGANGIIENTANGTNLPNRQPSLGINAARCTNCTIQNLTISNIYVHAPGDTTLSINDAAAIKFGASDNMTIDRCTVHDGLWLLDGWGNNVSITNNDIYNMDHGIAFAPAGSVSNLVIAGNHIHDHALWDTGSADRYHHDGLHMWGGAVAGGAAGDRVNGADIYNNTFDGDTGTCCTTANIFLEEQIQNVRIFNNIFVVRSDRSEICIWFEGRNSGTDIYASGHGVNNSAYNNYIQSGSATGSTGIYARYQDSLSVINNVIRGGHTLISLENGTTVAPSGIRNNVYENTGKTNAFGWNGSSYATLTAWQNGLPVGSGKDAGAKYVSPSEMLVNADGTLQAGSAAIGSGANLTTLGINALSFDKAGRLRPASGPWDAGAFRFETPVTTNPPLPPTNLAAISK